jgi:phage terminase small subunit
MSRQPQLPTKLVRASEAAMKELSDRARAPIWLHLGALVEHARRVHQLEVERRPMSQLDLFTAQAVNTQPQPKERTQHVSA